MFLLRLMVMVDTGSLLPLLVPAPFVKGETSGSDIFLSENRRVLGGTYKKAGCSGDGTNLKSLMTISKRKYSAYKDVV